ncbi:MAG: hypothetical protein AAGF94_07285 [Pseudomonadota bacterium]
MSGRELGLAIIEVSINCADGEESLTIGEALLRDRVVASFDVYPLH